MTSKRRLSIATKLPLGLGALLLIVLAGMTLAAYVEVKRSSLALMSERLDLATRQVAELLGSGANRAFDNIRTVTRQPEITGYLSSRPDTAAAQTLMQRLGTRAVDLLGIELWDAQGHRLLAGGRVELPPMDSAVVRSHIERLRTTTAAITPLRAFGDRVEYSLLAPVLRDSVPIGYVVERRTIGSPESAQQLSNLIGSHARLLVGSRETQVWTDLIEVVPGPPPADTSATLWRYTRKGERVFAREHAVPNTPWQLIVEFPEGNVLGPAQRFLTRAFSLSIGLAFLGMAVGWFMSRRITVPLRRVTVAAEAIAAGRPAETLAVKRADEVGSLATSFNTMARQVEQARRGLEQMVEHYRLLFDRNPLPMAIQEPATGRFLDVNEAAVRLYGYPRERLLQMTLADLASGNDLTASWPQPDENGGQRPELVEHRRSDGSAIAVEVTRHELTMENRNVTLTLLHNVTERLAAATALRENEEAMRRLNAELEQRVAARTEALERANRELEAFSYSVSHDLRAPLRAIDGFARILLRDYTASIDPEAIQHLQTIARNAQNMGQLIDDLLMFSRVGRQQLTPAPVDLQAVVNAVVEDVRHEHEGREIEFIVGTIPPTRGERALLRQVFLNLVQNAAKFTRDRSDARVEIGHRMENGRCVYFVRDNGAGFDMRYADKLFGVFQRLHRTDEFEGTGVGLAIVQRIIHRHGGRIWADGNPGQGAAFYFTLWEQESPAG